MTQHIQIGGKLRPVRFGFAGLLEYEKQTGRKALADFAELSKGIEQVSISLMVDMVYSGLLSGCRAEKINVDFDEWDVAEWITENQEAVQKVMEAFADSFQKAGNAGPGKATKTKPTPAA